MTVSEYLDRLEQLDVQAAALTDTHNLFGAFRFHEQALSRGIKPVIGVDLRISSSESTTRPTREQFDRLRVLVENEAGYRRLSHLISESYRKRGHNPPAVPRQHLAEETEGLYILGPASAGPAKPPSQLSPDSFGETLDHDLKTFGDAFYTEVPLYPSAEDWAKQLARASREREIPCVPTRPAYFPEPGDESRMRLRRAVQTNTMLSEQPSFPSHRTRQFVADPEQLQVLAERVGVSLEKSHQLAHACYFEFRTDQFRLPAYPFSETTPGEELATRCRRALQQRNWDVDGDTRTSRLERELNVIREMGFADYFLIVADVINWARDQGIRVGPGRGSAAGSLVAFLLGITTVNPFEFDLIFERFLNPQRNEMPDIDIDFADNRRGEVIEYIRQRFGEESVAHIITFGRMKARNSIRDVGRIRGEDQRDIDALAEMIPSGSSDPLARLRKQVDPLKNKIETDGDTREWFDQAEQLEGMVRNPSVHAAGILITEDRLDQEIPLYHPSGEEGVPASQFDMYDVEKLGYLKLDILGLKTLTQIEKTLERIPVDRRPDCDDLPDEDPQTFELFAKGALEGVFQYESTGSRKLVRQMKPENRRDIVDCIALYRPGPMEIRDDYLKRRKNSDLVEYPHPDLKPILEDTYGLILYQEQVMAIAREIGGFTWAEADTLRKAMGKKKAELMNQMEQQFIEGAQDNGYESDWARGLFDTLARFAEYGFNRSHSAAYGEVTYTTAYLKAHFPAEFYAGFLTIKSGDHDRIARVAASMKKEGVEFVQPSVNHSAAEFTVEKGAVRYGLQAVKHVGQSVAEAIETEQADEPFKDLFDFVSRMEPGTLHARAFQALAGAGAFDDFDLPRGWIVDQAESLLERGKKRYRERESGQSNLFRSDGDEETSSVDEVSPQPRWSDKQRLRAEKRALGFLFDSTTTPDSDPGEAWERFAYPGRLERFGDLVDREEGPGAGCFQLLARKVHAFSDDQDNYFRLEDDHEEILLGAGEGVSGKVEPAKQGYLITIQPNGSEWRVQKVQALDSPESVGLEIRLASGQNLNELRALRDLLHRHEGDHPVRLILKGEEQMVELNQTIDLTDDLAGAIDRRLGKNHTCLYLEEPSD